MSIPRELQRIDEEALQQAMLADEAKGDALALGRERDPLRIGAWTSPFPWSARIRSIWWRPARDRDACRAGGGRPALGSRPTR